MDAGITPGYSHTQKAPLCLIVYVTAICLLVGSWFTQDQPTITLALAAGGAITAVIASAFHHLTVEDQGNRLAVRFGPMPLPMFRMTIRYDDIDKVDVGRTLILDGWGIHHSIRGGWVWNLWGRDCVVVHRKNGGVLRIGTDDTENLARFLESKIAEHGRSQQ